MPSSISNPISTGSRWKHEVDCVDTGDRSWGPRPERDNSSVIWWHASFGESLTAHLFVAHDLAKTNDYGKRVSGYVLEDGKTYGIKECRGTQEYRKAVPMGVHWKSSMSAAGISR